MDQESSRQSWPVTMSVAGRVVIPKEARESLGWGGGTELVFCPDEHGGLSIKSLDQFINEVQEYFVNKFGPDRCLSDELIAERRKEAEHEERNS